ncbi:uncharacterized protein [Spinacia oleracea]|uniref:Myb/SANT-like domain-containing protein n=1 Tax=Spinacia oleracea TaxID=3562 RepID=A0ABM3REE0_SPIOL|nr:uncharacterized protein LOC130468957 [Spinacia oleracea]
METFWMRRLELKCPALLQLKTKGMYTHLGFGWDYRRKMVDVDYELWKDNIEVHPESAPYRKYGCPLYDDLCNIFTKPIATGKHAFSPEMITSVTSSTSRRKQGLSLYLL